MPHPMVMAATMEDSLDVSWSHTNISGDLKALGYKLEYHIGVDCLTVVSVDCRRSERFISPGSLNEVHFMDPKPVSQDGIAMERGVWYDVRFEANYTAPEATEELSRWVITQGGIYPEVDGVDNIVVTSVAGNSPQTVTNGRSLIRVNWDWDAPITTDDFRHETGYRQTVEVTATGTDIRNRSVTIEFTNKEGDTYQHGTPVDYTVGNIRGQIISGKNVPSFSHGVVFDVVVNTTYRGGNNGNFVYVQENIDSTHKGTVYPHPGLAVNVTDPMATSGDEISVNWTAPDLTDYAGIVNQFGYRVSSYDVKACLTLLRGSCEEVTVVSTDSTEVSRSLMRPPLDRGVLYDIEIRTNYQGRDTDNTSSSVTDKVFSLYERVPGSHYINPMLEPAKHSVRNLRFNQTGNESILTIDFDPPGNIAAFTALSPAFTNPMVTHNITLYDTNGPVAGATRLVPPQPLDNLVAVDIDDFAFSGVDYTLEHHVRVRTTYPTGQSVEVNSTSKMLTPPGYQPVKGLRAVSGPDNITVYWSQPDYIPVGATISRFIVDFTCYGHKSVHGTVNDPGTAELKNKNCNNADSGYFGFYSIDQIAYNEGQTDYNFIFNRGDTADDKDIEPGIVYLVNVTVEYIRSDNAPHTERTPRRFPSDVSIQPKAAIFPHIIPPQITAVAANRGSIGVTFDTAEIESYVILTMGADTPRPLFTEYFNYRSDTTNPHKIEFRNPGESTVIYEDTLMPNQNTITYTLAGITELDPLTLYNISVVGGFTVNSENTTFSSDNIMVASDGVPGGGYESSEPTVSATAASNPDDITVTIDVRGLQVIATGETLDKFREVYYYNIGNYTVRLCAPGETNKANCFTKFVSDSDRHNANSFNVVITTSDVTRDSPYEIEVIARYAHGRLEYAGGGVRPPTIVTTILEIPGEHRILSDDRDGDMLTNDMDIDDDGDGLIEVRTAAELDAIRHQLDGTGFKQDEGAILNQTGCGNGGDIDRCSGYELVSDISLVDYIAEHNATAGWQPIAADVDLTNNVCDGDKFTGIFDGNGFEVSGLFINRSTERCIGLFGQVDGTIRRLGVEVDEVIGGDRVGGLVGGGSSATIVESFVMGGMVQGTSNVGGLVGDGGFATIDRSYAASDIVSGTGDGVGGLVGHGNSATIIQSYAVNDEVRGNHRVGGLAGNADNTDITRSYAVSGEVMGNQRVGGLVGGGSSTITRSYAVSREVRGRAWWVGGLIGHGNNAKIVQSYAVGSNVLGDSFYVGGLAGIGWHMDIIQSYGVSEEVQGRESVGGLIGDAVDTTGIIHSYAVNGRIRGSVRAGLVGAGEGLTDRSSYWDTQTSGEGGYSEGGSGKNTNELRSPTGYTGIYGRWDDGITLSGVDKNSTIWCDTDSSGSIEEDEKQDSNWVWDFGTNTNYPAIRCTEDSLADQRAWWYLNSTTHKPNLNSTRLDAWLDGSLLP